jgi:uracil-DNA glycosylase family 4
VTPKERKLDNLALDCLGCRLCPLHKYRTNMVHGEGSAQARLVIVGEAPSKDEDEAGRPFVGAAGRQLGRMFKRAGITREEVYLVNAVQCKTPGGRKPSLEEIRTCRQFLMRKLTIIKPQVVLTLGSKATYAVVRTTDGPRTTRDGVYWWKDAKVLPSIHPSFVLQHLEAWPRLLEDVKKAVRLSR